MSTRSGFPAVVLATGLMVGTCLLGSIPALAQDAGVSGIPRGPGNAGGLNNSLNDPSGAGNAAKVAPPAAPSLNRTAIPSGFPSATVRTAPVSAGAVHPRGRRAARHQRLSGRAREAAIRENDQLLNRKLKSICRGC